MKRTRRVVKALGCILMLTLCISSLGCAGKEKTGVKEENSRKFIKKLPSAYNKGEDPIICIGQMDLDFYGNNSMVTEVMFHVLSKEPLNEKNVKVEIDTETKYSIRYVNTEYFKKNFQEGTCLQYNNMNWKHFRKLEETATVNGGKKTAELEKINEDIESDYKGIINEQFPKFYDNIFYVSFDLLAQGPSKDEEIKKINFIINGKIYTEEIGRISLNYTKYPQITEAQSKMIYGENDLYFDQIGMFGVNIRNHKKGVFLLPYAKIIIKKDVKIKNIYLENESENLFLDQVTVDYEFDGEMVNQKWEEGSEIPIVHGTEVALSIKVKSKELENKKFFAVGTYIVIEYEVGGKINLAKMQAMCMTRYDSEVLYAMFKDKIDMTSYFSDYLQE